MSASEGHVAAVARTLPICMSQAATAAIVTSRSKLLPRVMSGSLVRVQLGYVSTLMACVTTGIHKTFPVENLRTCAESACPSLSLGWIAGPAPLGHCNRKADPTSMGEMAPHLTIGMEEINLLHGYWRTDFVPYLWGLVPVAQIDQLNHNPDPYPRP